ncbi:MAG: extracytoplasmic sigma factor ECF [Planctomycetota bacterium]|nr:MAG: extracytoplasmic sigma factor ECF [Planctomycetota bacterium]
MSCAPTDVTVLIHRLHDGDEAARADLWSRVYAELHGLAAGQMARERSEHTLQPTALVHEAWLRLAQVGDEFSGFEGRAHFFGAAGEAMRRILVEHARRRAALRRGGDRERVPLSDLVPGASNSELASDVGALDEALARLEASGRHARKCEVVKLRFFVGLTIAQTAQVLETSPASVKRDWEFAKAWLSREMARDNGSPA